MPADDGTRPAAKAVLTVATPVLAGLILSKFADSGWTLAGTAVVFLIALYLTYAPLVGWPFRKVPPAPTEDPAVALLRLQLDRGNLLDLRCPDQPDDVADVDFGQDLGAWAFGTRMALEPWPLYASQFFIPPAFPADLGAKHDQRRWLDKALLVLSMAIDSASGPA